MFLSSSANVNATVETSPFVAVQLSYSTADIEQSVFFGSTRGEEPPQARHSLGVATLLAVNGELFALDDQTTPTAWPPLSEHSGLIQLVRKVSGGK